MKCKNCNAELLEGSAFCPYCGTKCDSPEVEVLNKFEIPNEKQAEQKESEASCWEKFANISRILGIVTMCTFWIPIFGLFSMLPGIPGIVFGALGKHSKKNGVNDIAASGFTKSLVGTILSIVAYIFWVFAIVSCAN